jgi:hypothetical protein
LAIPAEPASLEDALAAIGLPFGSGVFFREFVSAQSVSLSPKSHFQLDIRDVLNENATFPF